MNKISLLKPFAFLAILIVTFSACNKDDDKPVGITDENIAGKWEYIWQQGYVQDGSIYQDLNEDLSDKDYYLVLHEDGTFQQTNETESFSSRGTWEISERDLLLYHSSYVEEFNIVELRVNTLTLDFSHEEGSYQEYVKFTLKRR